LEFVCSGNGALGEWERFSEGVQRIENFIFGEDEEVIVTGTFDIDKSFGAGVQFVEFFSISLVNLLIVVSVDNEEGEFNLFDSSDVGELISGENRDAGDGAKCRGDGGD